MSDIATVEPEQIRRGDTVTWKRALPDHPAPTWVLRYELLGPARFAIIASASGTDHLVSVPKATTANWNEGFYVWGAVADDGTTRETVGFGRLEIQKDFASLDVVHDPRTHAEKMIANIERELELLETLKLEAYGVGGRTAQRRRIETLLETRRHYIAEHAAERRRDRQRRGLPAGGRIKFRL